MDTIEVYRRRAAYNRWMNERLFAIADEMGEDARRLDRGAFFGSVHGTLGHILLGDRIWLRRLTGDLERHVLPGPDGLPMDSVRLDVDLYPDFDDLRRERARTDADLSAWIDGLTPAALAGDVTYTTTTGAEHTHPLWWAVEHLLNHQTHHRGQVTTLMMQAGHDPGVTDLAAMLRAEGA